MIPKIVLIIALFFWLFLVIDAVSKSSSSIVAIVSSFVVGMWVGGLLMIRVLENLK